MKISKNIYIYSLVFVSTFCLFSASTLFWQQKQKTNRQIQEKKNLLSTYESQKTKIHSLYLDRNALLLSELSRLTARPNVNRNNGGLAKSLQLKVNQIIENMDRNTLLTTSDWTAFEYEIERTHQIVAALSGLIAQSNKFWKDLLKVESKIEQERKQFAISGMNLGSFSGSRKIAGFQADQAVLEKN